MRELKQIEFPVRVGFKNPCLKDATDRVIIKTPARFFNQDINQDDWDQWRADLETICYMMNIGYTLS